MDKTRSEKYCVPSGSIVKDAIQTLNTQKGKIVIVLNSKNVVVGTITDGDIRRALLDGVTVDYPVEKVMNKDFLFIKQENYSEQKASELFIKYSIKQLPILDTKKNLVSIIFSDDIKAESDPKENCVVIMAGGMGRRLGKITNECPKPMLLVNNKPIIEHIIDRMRSYGFSKFYVTVNYLKDKIKSYLDNGNKKGIDIQYIEEEQFLGTAGSLSLLEIDTNLPIIVLNGDVLSMVDFDELLHYFEITNTFGTVCAREHSINIPYGVIQADKNYITKILEKPDHSCYVNAGIYVFNPTFKNFLEKGVYCDMPTLINKLVKKNCKINYFPIHEYWVDVGIPETLIKANDEWDA